VYSASYALIAAIPYDWGSHDEDGEWQSTRDSIRFLITLVGSLYLTFSGDQIARARAVEIFLKSLIMHDFPKPEVTRAAKRLHLELTRQFYARRHWFSADDEEFSRSVLRAFESTVEAYNSDQSDGSA
jgi:hypothetical protein